MRTIINHGIRRVVSPPRPIGGREGSKDYSWSWYAAEQMASEAGIEMVTWEGQ